MKYKTAWTKGLVGEKREEMERELAATSLLRSRLQEIINEKIEARRVRKVSEEEYEKASWPFLQADSIGYERALREIYSLLEANSLKE